MVIKTIRLILGDQLNERHSWFSNTDSEVLYVLMEIRPESEYVKHHIQKILGIFAAMRSFADLLEAQDHHVKYFKISDPENHHSFVENIRALTAKYPIESVEYQEPDEYRLDELFRKAFSKLPAEIKVCSSEHFYTSRRELSDFFSDKKTFVMENFYRAMRRKHQVLMDGGQPVTGRWNYDAENRSRLPQKDDPPPPLLFNHNLSKIYGEIRTANLPHIGKVIAREYTWPITRK